MEGWVAANFYDCDARLQSVRDAQNMLSMYRSLYTQAKLIQTMWQRYDGNKDTTFTAAINVAFNAGEIAELKLMLKDILDLVKEWEKDHKNALGV